MTRKLLVAVLLQLLSVYQPAKAETANHAGRAKLAELMALIRQAPDDCEHSPDDFSVFALYGAAGVNAPSEDEIGKKENEVIALRKKVGLSQFCDYFVSQMRAAKIVMDRNAGH